MGAQPASPPLRLDRVTIERGSRVLLRDVDVTFAAGETCAILGANGVGKTSLLLALAGMLAPTRGTILLDALPLASLEPRARARRIALVDGTEAVFGALSVAQAVESARYAHHRWWEWQTTPADREAVDIALERVALQALRNRELGTLSAGERQRVWLAVAIAARADIILLDEPTSHLDLRYALETLELMRDLARAGVLVVCVLHSLEEAAAFCDRVIVLGDGRILADGPPAAALTPATLECAYGVAIDVECRASGLTFARRRSGDRSALHPPQRNAPK